MGSGGSVADIPVVKELFPWIDDILVRCFLQYVDDRKAVFYTTGGRVAGHILDMLIALYGDVACFAEFNKSTIYNLGISGGTLNAVLEIARRCNAVVELHGSTGYVKLYFDGDRVEVVEWWKAGKRIG